MSQHSLWLQLQNRSCLQRIILVPSKGLEPPHPCEYMDLNHARLPIPPRWHLQQYGGPKSADQEEQRFYSIVEREGLQNREAVKKKKNSWEGKQISSIFY